MYLRSIEIKNVKCFADLTLSFVKNGTVRKWTVLLGQNGLGKSTLLQTMAAALAGPSSLRELLPVAEGWVKRNAPYGEITAELEWTKGDAQLPRWPKKTPYTCRYVVTGDPDKIPKGVSDPPSVPAIVDWAGPGSGKAREKINKEMNRLKKTAYAEGQPGWLACGYGPFRRLSGGSQDADHILYSGRKAARFVTLFREDAALTNATKWLIDLHNTAREGDNDNQRALDIVKAAFETNLLPEPATLVVDARSANLRIAGGQTIQFQHLSDGYRSMLALGIDLLRWLIAAFPNDPSQATRPGVVLIDELDAHLHPIWQQRIGGWLQEKFPELQFIIASHSPFLAQVATETGGNIVLVREGTNVEARKDLATVGTWRADQILTELFGLESTRSPEVQRKLKQFLRLAAKKKKQPLSSQEQMDFQHLELFYESVPPSIEDPSERGVVEALKDAVSSHSDELSKVE